MATLPEKSEASAATQKTAQTVQKNFAKKDAKTSLDALSKAGQVPDRGQLTKAGRALDKHGGRPDSVFPKAGGDPINKNMQGQYQLDNILTHPDSKVSYWNHRRFGEVIDIEIPGYGGARFYKNGDFIGLLEP